MDIKQKIGNKLKAFRIERRLSQETLAHLADIDRTYVHDIEKGTRNISIVVLEKLANALNIPIKDFFDDNL
jgi:transcriptional regulator with XRE-family HTH domain